MRPIGIRETVSSDDYGRYFIHTLCPYACLWMSAAIPIPIALLTNEEAIVGKSFTVRWTMYSFISRHHD